MLTLHSCFALLTISFGYDDCKAPSFLEECAVHASPHAMQDCFYALIFPVSRAVKGPFHFFVCKIILKKLHELFFDYLPIFIRVVNVKMDIFMIGT